MSQFGCCHGYNFKFTLMLNSSSNIFIMTTQRRCSIKIMGIGFLGKTMMLDASDLNSEAQRVRAVQK